MSKRLTTERATRTRGGIAAITTMVGLLALLVPAPQLADSPPDAGIAFVPQPQSEPRFDVLAPPSQPLNAVTDTAAPVTEAAGADPWDQIHDVIARDGAHLYTETVTGCSFPSLT